MLSSTSGLKDIFILDIYLDFDKSVGRMKQMQPHVIIRFMINFLKVKLYLICDHDDQEFKIRDYKLHSCMDMLI